MELQKLQEKVNSVSKKFNFNWNTYVRFLHLVEEVGELGEAITVHKGDRKAGSGENALADHANLEEEFGDVIFSLTDLANDLGINLTEVSEKTYNRYEGKLTENKKIK